VRGRRFHLYNSRFLRYCLLYEFIVRLSIKCCVVCKGDGGTEIVLRDDESPLSIYREHPKHCVR